MGLLEKFPALAHSLNVHENGVGVRVVLEKFQVFMEFNVGFVAHTYVIGEPFMFADHGFGDEGECHVSALAYQGDISLGRIFDPNQIQVGFQIDHARGVGAYEANVGFLGRRYHLLFQGFSFAAQFPETSGHNNGSGNPFFAALFEKGGNCPGRGGYESQIHLFVNLGYSGMAWKSQDTLLFGVDGIDGSFVSFVQQGFYGLVSPFGWIFGSTDYCHGFGIENFFQHQSSPLVFRCSKLSRDVSLSLVDTQARHASTS